MSFSSFITLTYIEIKLNNELAEITCQKKHLTKAKKSELKYY